MQNALSCPRRFHVIGRVVGWRMADTGHSETQTFCPRGHQRRNPRIQPLPWGTRGSDGGTLTWRRDLDATLDPASLVQERTSLDQYVCSINNKIRAHTNDITLLLGSKSPKYEPISLSQIQHFSKANLYVQWLECLLECQYRKVRCSRKGIGLLY